jgi:hypothetical protein
MLKRSLIVVVACVVMVAPHSAIGQIVPEGIHSSAEGPTTICGVTASTAIEFETKISADPRYKELKDESGRFRVFTRQDKDLRQWAFSTKLNDVYPIATCRHLYRDADGSVYIQREMHCDDTRENCDRVFLMFNAMDQRVKQSLNRN